MRPEQVLIDEVSVEPQVLLKIGPFSCFCLCDPRGAQGEGSSGHKGVTRKGSSVEIEEVAGADAVGRGRMSRPQSATSLAGSAAGSATGLHPQAPAAAETPEAPVGRVGSTASAASAAPAAPATPGQQPQTAGGLLDPVVSNFQSALVTGSDAAGTKLRKVPEEIVNGCGFAYDMQAAEKSGKLAKDDPIQEHYKKGGFFGAMTSALGDKKTMYCHHITSTGDLAVRAAASQGKRFSDASEVWAFLGKSKCCCGRFLYDRSSGLLKCGGVVKADHDNTCNKETCIFIANGLTCPTPKWA
eukprot:CAMPEP_0170630694 /NCGR_PEP_ID=MMETSP0224-20130122/34163_1 /TAXON_ID=285029 /ORGANISM="Togula jolla, Strain CCCM 725" /LENGTH=298 /DNA_ID=CAMNT_0010958821 /DNA_START=23 /DNA_END=916 /DNA_ORIENTATION=-